MSNLDLLEQNPNVNLTAWGGTELMTRKLYDGLIPRRLIERVNIIPSRVRHIDPEKANILVLHDLPEDPESRRLADPEYRRQFAKLVFVSKWQQQRYNEVLGVPFREGVVIRNAVEYVDQVEGKSAPAQELRLIYHTTPHRGLELLAPMMEALLEDFPDANVHLDVFSSFGIYGWEARDKPYEPLFDRLRAHPWITYHGWKPNHIVHEYLKRAHAFVYPSIWPETSCIAAIEAMTYGCRVLTTTLGALPETLEVDPISHGAMTRYSRDMQELADDFYDSLHTYVSQMVNTTDACPAFRPTDVMRRHAWPIIAEQWKRLIDDITR